MKNKINLKTLFGDDARTKFRRFFAIMLPILITQSAIMGMNFVDTVMSGRAGAEQLAGTSIGGNLWMPIFTTINGILVAATPLTAHLSGAGKRSEIGRVIRYGLLLAVPVVFRRCIFSLAADFGRPGAGTCRGPHSHILPGRYRDRCDSIFYGDSAALFSGYAGRDTSYDAGLSCGPADQRLFKLCPDFR